MTRIIAIDPGHGGTDPGASSGGVVEKDVALAYALELGRALNARGCTTAYTRAHDVDRSLQARCRAANEIGAAVFVSVHCNASGSPKPHGFQVFHCEGSARGAAVARGIFDSVTGGVLSTAWAGVFPDNSPQCGNRRLYVLRGTRMPAVLVELGFLTNEGERALLTDDERRAEVCARIADAIAAHVRVAAGG